MQSTYDETVKDVTITVLFDPDIDVSFRDCNDPVDRLSPIENKDKYRLRRPCRWAFIN